ncbi:NLR family, CARD domain containing 5 isoform X4 [Acanthopagrus latus]|uniref:NLR family, CARD domain containing 5 isoform X4 n=1 Tax=Acanthopagrus latus TaxID=8177 RepID=UPI00187BF45F|nr:NLR family, CARD domain containing 5 isoform X4 [Acanthopagrus latus]XP_036963488.1 NLR family, CARD domain containing 5 isoform X4 [Acanthopagrus latus]XP_036963489.1 NLR family, CARD domain containing 5 isoform X4 [Acanthopagrus latus]XP_036963490.1 NLR family, CARD domain containing 5 isoform X4 [Acanthopagrus latus]XP_036963492.1 NLR family, CARD domain containing 5 isoform X4 [Acanthopagrus latus]XP_036963493.1 NLR family, CARD domain containing 5 isoform X4 [Acanthopagrus latus]XP_03
MDDEVDPDHQNVNSVLHQESSELLTIINSQLPAVIMELCQMMPGNAGLNINHLACSAAARTEHIRTMLEYFRAASAADCCNFLQTVCMLCENIPMHLESRLMSVAGYTHTDARQLPATEPVSLRNTDVCEKSSPSVTYKKSSSPPLEPQLVKRPRIADHWEQYIVAVMDLLLGRWERLSERLLREVLLENVWVSPKTVIRGRDRPDRTPGSADRGSRTPESDGDLGFSDTRVTLETFLQGCAGKVTVLVGQSGSGKTLLMSVLGQQWARGLGPVPSYFLFVLLEFRQLNLLSRPLSLSELLFRHYLLPKGGDYEKRAIMDYLLSNPEQSCWVLDGYDEFHRKLPRQEVKKKQLDPEKPLPVEDLISGLWNRQLLPGCTVMVTCRARDVIDFEGLSDKVGQLREWDCHDIKEYVHNYFKANRSVGEQAADLILSTPHLLAMSSLPARCNICCICLDYLLLEGRDATRARTREIPEVVMLGGGGSRGENHALSGDQGGGMMMDTVNGTAQLPSTLTQAYLTVLGAFLSRDPERRGRTDTPNTMTPQESTVWLLSQYRSELCELSQLAWKGVESSQILFMEEDISQGVLKFSINTGLLTQVEVRREDGTLVNSYCFIHLTVQEFFAALRIMTSRDVSDAKLKKTFSLKTRWMTKSDQRTVFTDSLYLYVCGLASQNCTQALVEIARTAGKNWVHKRQALVLKLLDNLCHNNLTGPKVLELCHCVQESQDRKLAQKVVETRATLELRNIRLLPNDIDALAFVVNSKDDHDIGLDFGACSMELDCLDVLPRCQYIHFLCFHSRKYGDKFAEKLSSILPKFTTLRKLEFCGSSLTAAGAASLASALQNCPHITEINLSDNNLKDPGIKHIADVCTKLPSLASLMLGRNNSSLKAVDYLIRTMSSCLNIQHIHADGMREVRVTFCQNSDFNNHKPKSEPTISLLNQKWSKADMQKLAESLTHCPALSVLDLSGGQWDLETLRMLTQFLPRFNVSKEIIVNESCSSVEAVVILTALLSDCPAVIELRVRLQSPVQVSVVFSGGTHKPAEERSKILCLSCCSLLPADLEKVWRSLGTSSELTLLDLSSNSLGNKGLGKLLEILPRLSSIREINASSNQITMDGVLMLAGALCSHNNLTQIHISLGGREQVTLKFCPDKSEVNQQLKMFRINNSSLLPTNVTALCRRLLQCRSHLELDLSHSSLTDKAIENLLKVLPKMKSLQRLNISHSIMSADGALNLVSCLTVSHRVTSLELRPQAESFIQFDSVTAEHTSCRLNDFDLNGKYLERLLEILQHGPRLSALDLTSNQLEDEGVRRFVDSVPVLPITSYINLSNNSLTQRGLLDVAGTLCACGRISGVEVGLGAEDRCLIWFAQSEGCEKTLSLRESSLERDHLVRLADIMSLCPSLTKVELRNNLLQSDWIVDFVKQLNIHERGLSVSIEEGWIRSEEAVTLVCRCLELNSSIHTIKVQHTTLHLSLTRSTELTSVSFVDCAVEGHQLAPMKNFIQKCPLLTELDLSHNRLGLGGAEFLCSVLPSLPHLSSLSIASKGTFVIERLSEALLQATAIQCLNLSGNVIGDTAAEIMSGMFPRLRSLNLSHCLWSTAGGLQLIRALRESVSLESLSLDSLQLNEESRVCLSQSLRNIKSLRSLKMNKIAMEESGESDVFNLLTAMEGLTRMEEIELDGWRMADGGTEQLTRLLPVWTELRKISLSKNLISDRSGVTLLGALSSCTHLEELHLSGNSLGDLTAVRMALVLPSLTHITVLDISENNIGDEGSVSLSRAIMCLKKLTKLDLTSVGTSELCAIAASLAHCPLIQDVRTVSVCVSSMGWNNCGDEVVEELARVMPLCRKLVRIDLESNIVSVCGVEALFRASQSCPALQLIRLWRNKVSLSEAEILSQKDRRLNFSSI